MVFPKRKTYGRLSKMHLRESIVPEKSYPNVEDAIARAFLVNTPQTKEIKIAGTAHSEKVNFWNEV